MMGKNMLDIPKYDPHSPKAVKDIAANGHLWGTLAEQIRTNTCPHIILCGPTGCGKSLFLRIVLEYEKYHPVLRINCTANSGLRDLRDSIRGFARGSRTGSGDFRWVLFEHADALTADTQAFLRRMMETTSATTRFVFECTDAGAIAEPIQSRSALFVANVPDATEIRYELMRRTNFKLDEAVIDEIVGLSRANMRNALLHALSRLWVPRDLKDCRIYDQLLAKRPQQGSDQKTWIQWAVEAEAMCRHEGLDMRDLLLHGWPQNPDISYMLTQWSRLGGISPRALFFRCVGRLITA
jgi:replication factor C small subunit